MCVSEEVAALFGRVFKSSSKSIEDSSEMEESDFE